MKKTTPAPRYARIRHVLESARSNVARSVNTTQVIANWLIGREIVEEEQKGKHPGSIKAHAARAQWESGGQEMVFAGRYKTFGPTETKLKAELRRELKMLKAKEGQQ